MISEGRSRRGVDWWTVAGWLLIAAIIITIWVVAAVIGLAVWGAL